MPPKRSTRPSQSLSTIPIYQTLSNSQSQDSVQLLLPLIQDQLKENPQLLKLSFLRMLIHFCGLQSHSNQLKIDDTIDSLKNIVENAGTQGNIIQTPIITSLRNKFTKELVKRFRNLWKHLLQEDLGIVTNQKLQFNQSFSAWLEILTNVKIRVVRSAAFRIAKITTQQQIKHYQYLHAQKQSKKSFTLSKKLTTSLSTLIGPRLKDIDKDIRSNAFQLTQQIFLSIQSQVMNDSMLNRIFSSLFDDQMEIIDGMMGCFISMMQKGKRIGGLMEFLLDKILKVMDVSRNATFTGVNAVKIVAMLNGNFPQLKILSHQYLGSVLQVYAKQDLYYALHVCVQIFYNSIYPSPQLLVQNSTLVLIQLLSLLQHMPNREHIPIVLIMFFQNKSKLQPFKIFDIDNMFTLLMTQFYIQEDKSQIRLRENQIRMLLVVICQFMTKMMVDYQHCAERNKKMYEDIFNKFNNHVLVGCKELFFEKMTKYKVFSDKYLKLFSKIHVSTLNYSQLQYYIGFVVQKIQKLFAQDLDDFNIYKQIVNIYDNFGKSQDGDIKYSPKALTKYLSIDQLLNQPNGPMPQQTIYKISALLSKFPIPELTHHSSSLITRLTKQFPNLSDRLKLQVLPIFLCLNHYSMKTLLQKGRHFTQPYKQSTSLLIKFYFHTLQQKQQNQVVKLAVFKALVSMLGFVCGTRFQETKVRPYQLEKEEVEIVFKHVAAVLYNKEEDSSLDITRMLERLTFEDCQVKVRTVRALFQLFNNSIYFACHPESAKFFIGLIKGQQQLSKQSFQHNISASASLSHEIQKLMKELFQNYIIQEQKQKNASKLIYWRLAHQILSQCRSDQKFDMILQRLLSIYNPKKSKRDAQSSKILAQKQMLFIIHGVQRILQHHNFIFLDIYQNMLRKVSRRYSKEIIIRIKQYFIQKSQPFISNPYVKGFIELWISLAKVNVKKTKIKEEYNQQDSQQENMDENQGQEMRMGKDQDKKVNRRTGGKKVSYQKMEIQNNDEQQQDSDVEVKQQQFMSKNKHRNMRSNTKKKIK